MSAHKRHLPMLWVALPLLAGIFAASAFTLPIYLSAAIVIIAALLLSLKQDIVWLYPLLFGFGLLVTMLRNPTASGVEAGFNKSLALKIDAAGVATLLAQSDESGSWSQSRARVMVKGADTLSYRLLVGRGSVEFIDPAKSRYNASLRAQGFIATVYLDEVVALGEPQRAPLSVRMNRWAYMRLGGLPLSEELFASAAAMGIGRSEQLQREVRQNYQRVGASHLLALSGMHLGVVMILISMLTYLLPMAPRGDIYADIIALITIWLFAFMAGLSDSLLRSASMFSLLQLSRIVSRKYSGVNSLLAAAVLILCFDPLALYDLSFQLSFVAVAAILVVGVPLLRLINGRSRIFNFLLSSVVISFVATLFTAPITLYHFGYISLLTPLSTLLLLPALMVIVALTTIWILLPLHFMGDFVARLLEVLVVSQNYIANYLAELNWGYVELSINEGGSRIAALLALLIMILSIFLIDRKRR